MKGEHTGEKERRAICTKEDRTQQQKQQDKGKGGEREGRKNRMDIRKEKEK